MKTQRENKDDKIHKLRSTNKQSDLYRTCTFVRKKNQFPSYDGRTEKVNYKVASIQKRESNSKGHQISILSIYLNFNLV